MAFEKIRARLDQLRRGIPDGTMGRAAKQIKAQYLRDSISKRGNTPYTPTDVQTYAMSDGVRLTAPAWSMKIAHREGQPATWRNILAQIVRAALKGGA